MNQSEFQAFLDKQIKVGKIYNIVMHVKSRDGRINLRGASGIADAKTNTPMTVDTPYFLASVSKMYTVATVMKLYEAGQLDLDAPISDYLPDSLVDGIHVYKGTDYSHQIKVYQLVNMTSGLNDYFDGKPNGQNSVFDDLKNNVDRPLTTEKAIDIARHMTPKFPPNEQKAFYSDTNYQLLGAIIESVTGKTVREAFQTMLIEPLGLANTYAYDVRDDRPEPPHFYYKSQEIYAPEFMTYNIPDGGMVATVHESQVFLQAFLDGALFDKGLLDRMTAQWRPIFFPLKYGYGMIRFKLPRIFSPFAPTPDFIGHSGASGAISFYNVDKQVYFTGTINQTAMQGKPYQLMSQILNKL